MLQGILLGRRQFVDRILGAAFEALALFRLSFNEFAGLIVVAARGVIVALALDLVCHSRIPQVVCQRLPDARNIPGVGPRAVSAVTRIPRRCSSYRRTLCRPRSQAQ